MEPAKYLTDKVLNDLLPKETADKFQIKMRSKRTSPKFFHPKHGEIDFRSLTIKQAEKLVSQKAEFIESKPTK